MTTSRLMTAFALAATVTGARDGPERGYDQHGDPSPENQGGQESWWWPRT